MHFDCGAYDFFGESRGLLIKWMQRSKLTGGCGKCKSFLIAWEGIFNRRKQRLKNWELFNSHSVISVGSC